jgi:hypothetical protein
MRFAALFAACVETREGATFFFPPYFDADFKAASFAGAKVGGES